MKYKTTVNPNVKTDWTKKQLALMSDQLNKYQLALEISPRKVFTHRDAYGDLTDSCQICIAVGEYKNGDIKCRTCPLSDGSNNPSQCAWHPTIIMLRSRHKANKPSLQSRLDYLTAQFQANGLDVVDI